MNIISKAVAIAALLIVPTWANASLVIYGFSSGSQSTETPSASNPTFDTTISAPDTYFETFIASGSGKATYTYTALQSLIVSDVFFSSNSSLANVQKTAVEFRDQGEFSFFGNNQGFSPFLMAAGEEFIFSFVFNGPTSPVLMTSSFTTTPIPVPAALPLLLGGIAALGVAGRKKRAAV